MSDADKLPQFWLLVENDYLSSSDKAIKGLTCQRARAKMDFLLLLS
jgi:hypothetical protein